MIRSLRLPSLLLAACFLASPSAFASDCAPLAGLPKYKSDDAQQRSYAAFDMKITKGDSPEIVHAAGRTCRVSYEIKSGVAQMTDPEIQATYSDQIRKLGGAVTHKDDNNLFGNITRDGKDIWASIYSQGNSIEVRVVEKVAFKPTLLPPSGTDYRLLGHMPTYQAGKVSKAASDKYVFRIKEGDEEREVEAQGAKHIITYEPKPNGVVSDLEVQENYRQALAAQGAQVLWADDQNTIARFELNGQTVWARIYSQESYIEIAIIEEKPIEAAVKPPEANALKAALDKNGRIALYVNFDFNKSVVKPESAPVIAQIVKLLKDNRSLKISIDGHTDNVGGHDYNMKLSQARAAAVVAAVVAQGIAKDRMTSAGHGPDSPIDDNNKPEGRAKNRRVELVKG